MALTLGESHASTHKSLQYLKSTRAEIEKVQLRLSSGNKIVSPGDDVGGLAVAMKLQHQMTTTSALVSNVNNAKSFAEMQYTALSSAADVVSQMQSLRTDFTQAQDAGESTTAYESSFNELKSQLEAISEEKAGSVDLFGSENKSVNTSSTGSTVTIEAIDFGAGGADINTSTIGDITSDVDETLATFSTKLSGFMVQASLDQSTLGFASDYLTNMSTSLEAAHGRIMDVDIAEETINLSKLNLQQEAALAAIVQANLAMESVLELLISRND